VTSGKKGKRQAASLTIRLTDRTLHDLLSIEEYSIEEWGKKVAARYMGDFESALCEPNQAYTIVFSSTVSTSICLYVTFNPRQFLS